MASTESEPVLLIVEDEPMVRMDTVQIAQAARFKVLEAADATEALNILSDRPGINLMLTDVQLPGLTNGLLLAALVRERWPFIGIVVTSAHADPSELEIPARTVFLPKPYDANELIDALRAMSA